MPDLEEKLFHAYPEEGELVHEFSEEFEKKMEKLINRARQKESFGIPVSTGKRIAAIIIAAMIGFLTASLSVEAVREKLFDFVKKVHEIYTETIYIVPEGKVGKFEPLYPDYIPRGYELTIKDTDKTFLYLCYENKEKNSFFIQEEQIKDMSLYMDNEYIKEEEAYINNWKGKICYKKDGRIRSIWETDNCIYIVSATDLSKKKVLKICESLK